MPLVDVEQAVRVGRVLARAASGLEPEGFTDPRFYPDPGADAETVAMYFLVMVAMDHRVGTPWRPYEAVVEGERLHGADLLYRLGRLKLDRDPGFFTAERLARVTPEEVRAWLCLGGVCPRDPEKRAALLRDLGGKLLLLYGGSAYRLVEESMGFLHTWDPRRPGLVERLRVFAAYDDPVEKKPMLLAKFLERRGLLHVEDPWNKRVPVDNHLSRIAVRTGIVRLEPRLRRLVEKRLEASPWDDVSIRLAAREAWHVAAEAGGIDDFILDDLLWSMGRRLCTRGRPACRGCSGHPFCRGGACVLAEACPVGLGLEPPVDEHLFLDTHWY